MIYHVITYTGPFGYLKPWTAVRDGETFSQPFLPPSTVEGMRIKLGVSAILRHRLSHRGLSLQQEQVQAAGWAKEGRGGTALVRPTGVLKRWVMLRPRLHLAFATPEDAQIAAADHLCLCRNEDLIFPTPVEISIDGRVSESGANRALIHVVSPDVFDLLAGFEVLPDDGPESIPLGMNRYMPDGCPMRGRIIVAGDASGEASQ